MEKLKMQTANIADENFKKLAAMFPHAVTETVDANGDIVRAIDKDVLMQEINTHVVEGREERYQFTWPEKRKAILAANAPSTNTLRPCREDSINFDTTENLYIEGDNLEVLKLLQENYLGKVKMIYIDPPYNTGNDFVYDDNFAQNSKDYTANSGQLDEDGNRIIPNPESNGRFHTDWLNMVFSRIKIARNLLSDDGLIFISIDDNEVTNMKKICDEIFGPSNFKSQSIVVNNRGGRDYGGIALQHDYILIYAKSPSAEINLIEEKDKQFQYYDELGGFNLMELRNRNVKFNDKNRPNLCYPFYVNPSKKDANGLLEIALEPKQGFVEVYPAKSNGIQTVWRWGKEEKARKGLNIDLFGKVNQNGGYMVVQKYRKTTKMQRSIWDEKEFVNERGTEAVKELLGAAYFDYPKSPYTIRRVVELGSTNDCIIMDFFSGSSTTAHAVMQINAEEGGNRKYIMVQLPAKTDENSAAYKAGYKNICDIAKERIRQAAKSIQKETGEKSKNVDFGFRVLKLDTSNMEEVYYTPEKHVQDPSFFGSLFGNIKEDRTGEDLLFQAMLELDVELSSKIETTTIDGKTVYNVADNYLLACFDENVTDKTIEEIAKLQPSYFVMRDSSMANDSVAVNFEQLFKSYSPSTTLKVF